MLVSIGFLVYDIGLLILDIDPCSPATRGWSDIVEEKKFKALLRRTVGIPVIALAILAALLLVEIQALRNSLRWVEHADQAINADRELIKLTIDTQTDVRGFLYTGKSEFLQPYKESVQIIDSEFTTLNQLVSDESGATGPSGNHPPPF